MSLIPSANACGRPSPWADREVLARRIVRAAGLALALSACPAHAVNCPAKIGDDDYLDKVGAAIKATKSCSAASELAQACALGASGDAATAPVAERKCGLDFWVKLTSEDKKVYNSLQAKCDAKYKGMEGTMWISAAAFCRLQVARLYSELYAKPDAP